MNTQFSASGIIAMFVASSLAPICFDARARRETREIFACELVGNAHGPNFADTTIAPQPFTAPGNDHFAGAFNAYSGSLRFSLLPATKGQEGQGDTDCWGENSVDHDVWYVFVAPISGTLTISMCDSEDEFDSRIALYPFVENEEPGAAIACNDDGCSEGGHARLIKRDVEEGQAFYIQVGAVGSVGSGDARLDISIK